MAMELFEHCTHKTTAMLESSYMQAPTTAWDCIQISADTALTLSKHSASQEGADHGEKEPENASAPAILTIE